MTLEVRAGERDGLDALVGDHSRDALRAHKQRLERTRGEAGAAKDLLQRKCTTWNVRGMLEQPDVARHQGWGGKADHLPEREVPRHHREDRPERQVADVALIGVGLDRFVGEQAPAVFREMAASPGAFLRFRHGRLVGLAHFPGHHLRPPVLLALQDLCRLGEPAGARGEGGRAVGTERLLRPRQSRFQLRVADLVEALDELAGAGIDALQFHA
jgi:hypothetical protein